jgi:lipid-A-disaccharide synthase
VHADRPEARFLVACFKPAHRDQVLDRLRNESLPAEVHVGRTPEIIALADACVSVSGSVSLELLARRVPTVVVYRINPLYVCLRRFVLNVPYVSLVNLLAGRDLYPEYVTSSDDPTGPAGHLIRWLGDPSGAVQLRSRLGDVLARVGQPGACARAAGVIAELIESRRPGKRAA